MVSIALVIVLSDKLTMHKKMPTYNLLESSTAVSFVNYHASWFINVIGVNQACATAACNSNKVLVYGTILAGDKLAICFVLSPRPISLFISFI